MVLRLGGLIVSLMLASRPAAAGNVFHVTPTADLQALLASGGPGDQFLFADGVYTIDQPISMVALGTEDDPVLVGPEDGASPVIEMTKGWVMLTITKSSWVRFEGLTFQGGEGWDSGQQSFGGIYISDSTGITIRNCAVRQVAGDGIRADGNTSALTIQHTEVGFVGGTGISLGCYDQSCQSTDAVIDNNWVHDLGGWLDPKRYARTAIYVAPLSTHNAITNNVIYDVGDGISVDTTQGSPENTIEGNAIWNVAQEEYNSTGISVAGEAVVRNNIVFRVDGYGIRIEEGGNGELKNARITHNTIVDTERDGIVISGWAGKTGMVLANNVVANPLSDALRFDGHKAVIDSQNYLSSNVVTGSIDVPDDLLVDDLVKMGAVTPGGGFTDFADTDGNDFYPQESDNSPLVDLGDPSSEAWVPATDFNGLEREGDAPDVGAIEFFYEADTNPGWILAEGFKELTDEVDQNSDATGGGCCKKKESGEAGLWLTPLVLLSAFRRRRRP